MYVISILDLLLFPIYMVLLGVYARNVQEQKIAENPAYEYYVKGLYVKFLGAFALCMVYLFYYKEQGDTTNYMNDANVMLRMASTNFEGFWRIFFHGDISQKSFSAFNTSIGFPEYSHIKKIEWTVIRFTIPFAFLGLKFYLPTSILLAYVSYLGNWRLFLVFADAFPKIYKKLAFPLLFIPSCAFWGSGILKDTYTYAAMGFFTYGFYMAFIKRKNVRNNIIAILIASWVIISIKPYIFVALLPGSLIWLNFERLKGIKSRFLRVLAMPLLFAFFGGGGVFIMSQLGNSLDKYSSVDKALETAVVTQKDLKRSEYGGASFDIGDFEPTLAGISSKIPVAITAGLFRPFIWEARNPVMLISGLENLMFLGLTIWLFFKMGFIGFFKNIGQSPLLLFSLIFALFFAFSVGLTTSNFGSLVRYKIPCEPFYLGMLFALVYSRQEKEDEDTNAILEEGGTKVVYDDKLKKHRSNTGFIIK
jgi:hypothetical protein